MSKKGDEHMESNENKEFEQILHAVISEIEQLLIKKNKDYGAKNLLTFGSLGILIRLSDKLERLKNHILNNSELNNESLDDTLKDIAGYSIMWLVLSKENYELDYRKIIQENK